MVKSLFLSGRARRPLWLGSLLGRDWWFVPILVAAVVVRWGGLDKSVWEDEVISFTEYETKGWVDPHLTSLGIFWVCNSLIETGSMRLVRLPVLLIGLFAIWLGYALGRVWRRWLLGLLLATALAVWPFKAQWDTQVRYYAIMLTLMLAALVALEWYRARPTTARWALALSVSVLGALTHILALPVIALPWVYLAWVLFTRGVRGIWRMVLGRTEPGWWRLPLVLLVHLALLALATGATFQVSRGESVGGRVAALLERLEQRPDELDSGEGQAADRPARPTARRTGQAQVPTAGQAWQAATEMVRRAYQRDALSPNELFTRHPGTLRVTPAVTMSRAWPGDFAPHRPWTPWLMYGLAAGCVALLFLSPPMLAGLLIVFFGTNILLDANVHLHGLNPRYYVLPALAGLLVLIQAPVELFHWLRWPLHRRRPRWNAAVVLLTGLICVPVLFWISWRHTRAAAGYIIQDWKQLYSVSRQQYPEGILFAGIVSKGIEFYNRLDRGGYDEQTPADYWRSPWRNEVVDAFKHPETVDMRLADLMAEQSAVVYFNPTYWRYDYEPIRTLGKLFEPRPRDVFRVKSQHFDLQLKVIVPKGRLILPLAPRFQLNRELPADAPREYVMQLFFEVPGSYEVQLGESPACRPLQASFGNEPLALRLAPARPWPPGRGVPLPTEEEVAAEAAADPQLNPLADGAGSVPATATARPPYPAAEDPDTTPTYVLPRDWRAAPGRRPPIYTHARRAYRAEVRTPSTAMQRVLFSVTLDRDPGEFTPVVTFRRTDEEFVPVTEGFDIGSLVTWEEDGDLLVSAPLRMHPNPDPEKERYAFGARIYLVDDTPGQRKEIHAWHTPLNDWVRDYQEGDLAWLEPARITPAMGRQHAGNHLVLTLHPIVEVASAPGGVQALPLINEPRVYRPLNQFYLIGLRYTEQDGHGQFVFD
ncbi:MAG TPA: hypothetical protein PK847_02910 [Candidatus Sumerlaeota bacterium]|nr:hypothetical protein [Candidatus Sumerlaeota bacterium]